MKKIFILILLLLFIPQINAQEYTPYTPFGEFTEDIIKPNHLTDVKVERRYKYYKETKTLGPYELKENSNEDYPLVDSEDYTYTKESEYLTTKPEEKEGRVINTYEGIKYKKAKDVNYLILSNNSTKNIDITNFNLKYKDKDIDYTLETNNASLDKFENRGTVIIKFNKPIILSFLSIELDASSTSSTITIETFSDDNKKISGNSYTVINNYHVNWLGLNSYIVGDYDDYLEKKEINLPEGKAMQKKEELTIYTYKDVMYRKYKLEKEYYPKYLTGPIEDYINKDENDFKDYYAKRTRQIIETKPIETKPTNKELKTPVKIIPTNINPINDLSNIEENLSTDDLSYYDISYNPINKTKTNKNNIELWYFIGPFLILICVFILLLSKLYKRKKECVKV